MPDSDERQGRLKEVLFRELPIRCPIVPWFLKRHSLLAVLGGYESKGKMWGSYGGKKITFEKKKELRVSLGLRIGGNHRRNKVGYLYRPNRECRIA